MQKRKSVGLEMLLKKYPYKVLSTQLLCFPQKGDISGLFCFFCFRLPPKWKKKVIWGLKIHIICTRWASANKLSAVKDGSCFYWFHPSSNPCFDCSLKDVASILMISLALDLYLMAVRKSRLPSDLLLSAISCCLALGLLEEDRTWWQGQDKVAFCVNCAITCGG